MSANEIADRIITALEGRFRDWLMSDEHAEARALVAKIVERELGVRTTTGILVVTPDPTNDRYLQGQLKPTGEQVAWVLVHFADMWEADNQQSYGFVMQRMYGYPSYEKIIAHGAGQCLTNVINCAKEVPEVRKLFNACYV